MHWRYLLYLIRHKWFVFIEGLRLRVPLWRLIVHDWTKFLPDEWVPYARYFYGPKADAGYHIFDGKQLVPKMEPPQSVRDAFDRAWNFHQKRNPHHWQYWLLANDNPRPNFLFQSHDGGVTHVTINRASDGRPAALLWDVDLEWDFPADVQRELKLELMRVPQALPMPDADAREMLADWRGAGRALGKPDTLAWYTANKDNINLHLETREWIEAELAFQAESDRQEERLRNRGVIT